METDPLVLLGGNGHEAGGDVQMNAEQQEPDEGYPSGYAQVCVRARSSNHAKTGSASTPV